jgi:hypothetical protein
MIQITRPGPWPGHAVLLGTADSCTDMRTLLDWTGQHACADTTTDPV